jgi:predicted phage-related endonuclease
MQGHANIATFDSLADDPKTAQLLKDMRDKDGKPTAVLEMKTSKRVEDWKDDVPEYYALQAALYAYLLGVEQVYMVASFLEDTDYDHPEDFKPTARNTTVIPFRLHERYPDFEVDYLDPALDWWRTHVETGISPEYDEKADADVLKALRTTTPDATDDRDALIAEAEALKAEIDAHAAEIKAKEDRYKAITEALKKEAVAEWKDGMKNVVIPGSRYVWTVSRSDSRKVDSDALKKDGLFEKYSKSETTYRVTVNNFLAAGGDSFTALTQGTNVTGGPIDLDAFTAYLTAHSPVAPPATDRITVA